MEHEETQGKRGGVVGWVFLRALAAGSGLLFAACRDSVGTALYVTIDFPPTLMMDQLLVSGTVAGSGRRASRAAGAARAAARQR